MEEDALQDAWNLSLANGFKGSKEDFTKLLQSNNDFFNLSFNTFKEKDFGGDEEAYSNLLGIQRPQPQKDSKGNGILPDSQPKIASQEQSGQSEKVGTPSPFVEQELPVGVASREELISNIKDPYIKRQEQILLDASIERKKLVDELPIQDVRQKMMDSYEPLLQQKRQELQDSLDRGEIDANKANEGLNSYYEKVNTQVNQKLQTNFKLNEELKKVNEKVNDKAFKELNIVVKDKQAAIDLAYQEQIDQLSPLESIGNALYNSALMTSLIPAKTILLGEQLSEDFTVSLPIALYGILSGQDISDKTKQLVRGASQSVTDQLSAYKEIQDTEEKLKPTLPFLESLEKGEIDKASAAAVGTAVDFLRSMVTGTATMGTGTFGEIGAPMYMEAVRAKAKETGKKEEDIIAEDLEDETTALLSAGLATASEFYGLGTAANLMRNSIFKAGVKDQVKKNIPKLISLGKDISVASLKESGTEIFQQSVEKANKAALENGGIKTDEGRKAFLKESFNATFTKDAAETGASTFAGSMLLFGMGKGAASLRKTKAVIDKPTQELTDEEIKEVLNSKGDLEQLTEKIKGMYQSGALTEEGYNISQDKINRVLKYDSELSPTNNNREESIRLLAEREKLEAEMGSLHPTQRGGEQAKIAVIDKKLTELATEGIATKETTTEETTAEQRLENRTKEQENLFGDQHKDKRLPYGAAEISDITTTDKNGVTTATYVNPETKSVDAIITATNEGNFVGYVRVYENGKPTNMFSAKMQTSESGVFKNIITSAENALPNNVEVVETTTISKGGLRTYNKSRLVEKVDEDGNVVTRPTKYSAATKESLEEKGESAFNEFSTPVKSEAETELAEVKKAYPEINATITKKGLTYKISIDLPVLVKPVEMQKTTEETTKEAESVPNKDVSRLTGKLSGGKFSKVDAGFGEKGYNYTTPDGVEVTLREDNDVVDINGQEVQGDIQIDFIGVDKNRGEGLASKELKNILDAADESDMSVSLIVDSKGATETKQGLKKGELGLTDKQLKDWYKKRGFIFEGDSSYGYRPSKSEDVNKYKAKSYSAKSGEVTNENITDWSSPEDLKDAVRSGDIEKGFHENGADKLFYFDGNNIREVDNIDISYDFKNNKYKIQEQDAKEGKKENDSYFQELKEVKDSDTKQYWSVSEVPEGTDGTVVRVDGGAAFVKPDGDITGVFKDPDSKKKGVADNILKQAVKQGGKMLDNFDNYLTKVYQRNGFRIVSRTPFNEEFAPEGWNEAEHGKPDVVAMVYDPNNELDIKEKSFDDYDKAIEYRNKVLEQEANQESTTTQEEKVKTPAKSTTSETEGLTEKEKTKQGFEEYTEAANKKTKEKIKAVTDLFKAKIKEVRDKVKQTSTAENELRKDLAAQVKELRVAGRLSAKDAERLTQKALNIKISRPKAIVKFKNQLQKTLDIVDYNNKLDKAKATRRKLKPRKDALAGDKSRIKKFKKIDPTKVKDLDKYNEIADEMLASQKPSVRSDKGVKIAPVMPYTKVDEYLNDESKNQEKEKQREIKEEYEFLADMDLTYEELSEIIDTLEEGKESKLSQERKEEISRAMDTLKAFYEQDLAQKLEDNEYSKEDAAIIQKLIDADISKLFFADKVRAIRIIENILNNDSFAGVVDTLNTIDVANSKEALKGIKGIAPKIFFMRNIPISYLKQVATLTETMKALFSGNNAANAVALESGMTDLDTGLVKKAREHKAMVDEYNKLVKNMAGYNSSVNLATRAAYGFVTRTVKGTATQIQDEFNRRKGIILEQQEFFNSDERFEKQAEVLNKVVEELGLKDANSPQELNISENNKKIVDFFVDKFAGLYDSLSDVAEKVYNKEISEDERYTPDVHIKVDPKGEDVDLNQSLFFQDTIDTKESGMLMDTTKSKGLAKNERGKVTRVVSLDFDSTMMRKLDEALTEINTAEHVNKVSKFISKDNLSNFMDDTSANILRDKMTSYVQSEKGVYKNSQADEVEKVASKVIDFISNLMATKLLASVWMPVKQMIPVLIRSAVHMDTKSVGQMLTSMVGKNKEGMKLAEKYGTVALRGKQSSVDIDNLSKRMSGTSMLSKKLANILGEEKSLRAQKITSKIGEIYEKPLEWTLEKPDVQVAKASWYGYYHSKVTEGGKEFNMDKEMESPNRAAIQYANSMVAQTQNESQSSKMGDIFKSKTLGSKIVRNVLFPFANFVQNLRTNIYNNARIATSKTASKEDKRQALLGIVGAASEMVAFNIVAVGTRYLTELAIKGMLGLDDDGEDEREISWVLGIPMNAKERRIFYTNIISDLSPAPILDNVALYTVERINQAMIEAKGKNYNRFENSIVYAPLELISSETFLNSGGKFGSAYNLYTDTKMMIDMADVFVNDNTYTKTTMFGSTEKPLSAANEADAEIALAIQTFYLLAPLTKDFGSFSKAIKRDIDKSEAGKASNPTQLKKIKIKKLKLKKPKLQAPKLKR